MTVLKLLFGLAVLVFVAAIGAIAGALGMAVTAFVIAGGAHLIGFLTMGTAQAVAIWLMAGGAVCGAFAAVVQVLIASAAH